MRKAEHSIDRYAKVPCVRLLWSRVLGVAWPYIAGLGMCKAATWGARFSCTLRLLHIPARSILFWSLYGDSELKCSTDIHEEGISIVKLFRGYLEISKVLVVRQKLF